MKSDNEEAATATATLDAPPLAEQPESRLSLASWQGAMSIQAPNASDFSTALYTAGLWASPSLCTSDCVLVTVGTAAESVYYLGKYDTTTGAGVKTAAACRSLCLGTAWCVQLTFVARSAASFVLYSSITTKISAPTSVVSAWVKCHAGSSVAATCGDFAPPPPPPPVPAPVHVPAQMLRKTFTLALTRDTCACGFAHQCNWLRSSVYQRPKRCSYCAA
jgi:hypothetical protein